MGGNELLAVFKTDTLSIELRELNLSSLLEMNPGRHELEAGRYWQLLAWHAASWRLCHCLGNLQLFVARA